MMCLSQISRFRQITPFLLRHCSSSVPTVLGRSSKPESLFLDSVQAWTQPKGLVNEDRVSVKSVSDGYKALVCDGVGSKENSANVSDFLASTVLNFSDLSFMNELTDCLPFLPSNGASTLAVMSVKFLPNQNDVFVNAFIIGDSFLTIVSPSGHSWTSTSDLDLLKSEKGASFTPSIHSDSELSPRFYSFTLDRGSTVFLGSDGFDCFDSLQSWVAIANILSNEELSSFSPWLRSIILEIIEAEKDSSGMLMTDIRYTLDSKGLNLSDFSPTHLDDMSLVAIKV